MKKAALFSPYFGKLPNYFQLFLNSCAKNPNYDWYIFTDDRTAFDYPENVVVSYMTFEEFSHQITSKFSVPVVLESPQKIGDYRPLFGYIFSEYLVDYPYWGYCDNDLIFGQIDNFLDFEGLNQVARFGIVGHLNFFKNTPEVVNYFQQDENFDKIFATDKLFFYEELFREYSASTTLEKLGMTVMELPGVADIRVPFSDFRLSAFRPGKEAFGHFVTKDEHRNHFFLWNDGRLLRYILEPGNKNRGEEVAVEEYLYLHLQKRPMTVNISNHRVYKIIPNTFEDLEPAFFEQKFHKIRIKYFNLHGPRMTYRRFKMRNYLKFKARLREVLKWG